MPNKNSAPGLLPELQNKIDQKTKPPGSLGQIEALACQIGEIKQSLKPRMETCGLTIFAADHGIARARVSAFPQEVTRQMVQNFLDGGAAANVFARTLGIDLQVVDAGICGGEIVHKELINQRIGDGTENSIESAAMSLEQLDLALARGVDIGKTAPHDAVCFGEMGIGNTSAAALVCHKILDIELDDLVGRGTGVDDAGLELKSELLGAAAARTKRTLPANDALREYGGFEIAMMTGAMLGAAESSKAVLVDGFIATAAAVAAVHIEPSCCRTLIFSHLSGEHGHGTVLEALQATPLLALDMRLGEGTGALLAWPLVKSAAAMLNDMASFDSAGVSGKS